VDVKATDPSLLSVARWTASDSVKPTSPKMNSQCVSVGRTIPRIAPETPFNTWLLKLTRFSSPNGILIGSAVFADHVHVTNTKIDTQTDRQTDRQTTLLATSVVTCRILCGVCLRYSLMITSTVTEGD